MLNRVVEILRGPRADRRRALRYAHKNGPCDPFDEVETTRERRPPPGINLGTTRDASGRRVPVESPIDECGHILAQGTPGSGKTRLILRMRVARLRLCRGGATIDCKGELYEADLRWLAVIAATLPADERCEFIQSIADVNLFGRDALIPLNICPPPAGAEPTVHAYEMATYVENLIEGGFRFQGMNLCRFVLLLLGEHNLSLVEAPLLFDDEVLRNALVHRSRHEAVKQFFFNTFPQLPNVSKDALRTRFESLVLAENARLALGADTMIDFQAIVNRGLPARIYIGKGPTVPEEQSQILGELLFGLIMRAAYAPSPTRRTYQLYIDEFANLLGQESLSRRFRTALTTFRSYKVSMVLSMHNFAQCDAALRDTIISNVDSIALFRTSSRNAEYFGDFVDTRDPASLGDPWAAFASSRARRALVMERLQRMPSRLAWWYDRRKAHRAVLLRVAHVPEPHDALGWTEKQLEDFIQDTGIARGGFAVPRSVLRAQIDARAERLRELVRPPIRIMRPKSPEAEHRVEPAASIRKPRLG